MADRNQPGTGGGYGVIALGLIVAALIVSWGRSGSEPRYQIAGTGSGVVRLDTDSGALLACDMQSCRQIEQPMRAKTFGPLTVEVGDDKQPPKQIPKQP